MLRRGWESGRRYRRTDSGTGQFLFLQARDNIPQSFPLNSPTTLPFSLNLFIPLAPPTPPPSLPLLPYNRISPTTYLFTEHLMVKINYKWNAEMRNPGRHADNDGGSVRRTGWGREEVAGGRGRMGGERPGIVLREAQLPLIDRLLIPEGRRGVFQFNFVHINILIAL